MTSRIPAPALPEPRPVRLALGLPLARPAPEAIVTQRFGERPEAYARLGLPGHNGLDFAADAGELVIAVDDGQLVELRLDPGGYGLTVKLAHWWGESRYAHGRPGSVPIEFELGCRVRRGERLFLAGNGGHLHFGLRLAAALQLGAETNGFAGYADPLPHLVELGESRPGDQHAEATEENHAAGRETLSRSDTRATSGRVGRPGLGRSRDQDRSSAP